MGNFLFCNCCSSISDYWWVHVPPVLHIFWLGQTDNFAHRQTFFYFREVLSLRIYPFEGEFIVSPLSCQRNGFCFGKGGRKFVVICFILETTNTSHPVYYDIGWFLWFKIFLFDIYQPLSYLYRKLGYLKNYLLTLVTSIYPFVGALISYRFILLKAHLLWKEW